MTILKLVPHREPTPAEALLQKVKSIPAPAGMLQCPKCGGRTVMTTTNGARIDENGKYKRGTICDDRVCYHCHMMGVHTSMIPERPRVLREPKPRRAKPKAVK